MKMTEMMELLKKISQPFHARWREMWPKIPRVSGDKGEYTKSFYVRVLVSGRRLWYAKAGSDERVFFEAAVRSKLERAERIMLQQLDAARPQACLEAPILFADDGKHWRPCWNSDRMEAVIASYVLTDLEGFELSVAPVVS